MTKKHKKHHKSDKPATEEKPGIKLVLKVGGTDAAAEHSDQPVHPPPRGAEESHETTAGGDRHKKHKKKKKKHKHRDEPERKEKRKADRLEEMAPSDMDDENSQPPTKRQELDDGHGNVTATPTATMATQGLEEAGASAGSGRSLRERKHVEDETTPLQRCLDMIHKMLVRKDLNGFFAYPVTDNIAPSYSKIIQSPMDLSTMAEKIESNDYPTLLEYKADFRLMCENCMTYNHPETIYYKEAEKMLKMGLRTMSKEKLILMKRNTPFMALISDRELGIDEDQIGTTGGAVSKPFLSKPKVKKPAMSKFEAFPDRLTPEQILAQAQDAAKDAAEQLTLRKPHTKFGFLRRREDGSTTLNFLNPDNDGVVSDTERVVNLASLIGKVQNGTGVIPGFKEDKRNKATPVNYLNYGPYSSYAPVYDSSQCNLSKDDSDLLVSTYGDDAGIQYSYSIRHFVSETGEYALKMVDNLLDIITSGEHSKAVGILQQVEASQKELLDADSGDDASTDVGSSVLQPKIDFDSLRTLTELGIDVSFVDTVEKRLQKEAELQEKLDKTSKLIQDLQKTQYDRLSQTLPPHLGQVPGPDSKEQELADKVTDELTDLVKEANPADIALQESVRDAIGVTLDPISDLEVNFSRSDPGDPVASASSAVAMDTAPSGLGVAELDSSVTVSNTGGSDVLGSSAVGSGVTGSVGVTDDEATVKLESSEQSTVSGTTTAAALNESSPAVKAETVEPMTQGSSLLTKDEPMET